MAAVTFNISPALITSGAVSNSIVVLAPTAFVLNRLNTAVPFVSVTVIVSALPESSETNIDFTIAVVNAAQVYSVVTPVPVKSALALVYVLAISLETILQLHFDPLIENYGVLGLTG